MSNKTAFIFPGQGAQKVGMLSDIRAAHPEFNNTLKEASEVLGYDLIDMISQGPEEKLNQTEVAQPALLACSVALWRLYLAKGGNKPDCMAGHSLGEYSALVCGHSLLFKDALNLVKTRGRFMQSAVKAEEGAMAAVLGLDFDTVSDLCQKAAEGKVLSPANINCAGQIVIAGHRSALDRFIPLAQSMGARRVLPLPVSVPSHCALMQSAADQFADHVANLLIKVSEIPIVANVDLSLYEYEDQIRVSLIRQLTNPVRWQETIEFFDRQGVSRFVECGPGKVLSGLVKRIVPKAEIIHIGELLHD